MFGKPRAAPAGGKRQGLAAERGGVGAGGVRVGCGEGARIGDTGEFAQVDALCGLARDR